MFGRFVVPLRRSSAWVALRSHRRFALGAAAVLSPLLLASAAGAVTVDGQLDAAYGTALVTQTTQTSLGGGQISGDSNHGDLNFANGSELDQGYAFVADGVLHLFLAGNVAMELNVNQNQTVGHLLDIFVDAAPGGDNSVQLGPGHPLNGLTFDSGFEADYVLELVGDAGPQGSSPSWSASFADVTSGGPGTFQFLGLGQAGGPGTLVGGTNPHGILATIDNRNVGGVTAGCDASSGAGVTTGVEWAIPLAALGNPTECIRLAVLLRGTGSVSPVSNSVLGPVPPGTCPLGAASDVDFATIAGEQFFSVCPTPVDVPAEGSRGFALLGIGPNPTRGDRVRISFAVPDSRPARIDLIDGQGRVLGREEAAVSGGGRGSIELARAGRLAPGIYWVRLSQGAASVSRRFCVVR